MTTLLSLLILSAFGADYETEGTRAVAQLETMIRDIGQIEATVERHDLTRLFLFKKRTVEVLDSVRQKGLGNSDTFRAWQVLIVTFRYSSDYLERIVTARTEPLINKLAASVKQIVAERGMDDEAYTKITLATFTQVHELFSDLVTNTNDKVLAASFDDLKPALAQAIAKGKQGDRYETLGVGIVAYEKIKSLYALLNAVAPAGNNYNTVLNIQALTEFYGEYTQRKN